MIDSTFVSEPYGTPAILESHSQLNLELDIVIRSMKFLRLKQRAFYVDFEFVHGHGVEESVYTTDGIVELCFKPYGEYSGNPRAVGHSCWHRKTLGRPRCPFRRYQRVSTGVQFCFRARHHPHRGIPPLQRLPSFTAAPTVCSGEILGSYDAVAPEKQLSFSD
jgi:hypothetical protein